MSRGGIESYMMNYYRHIDKTRIQIDFIVHGFGKGVYDEEILSLGGKIFHVEVKSKNPMQNANVLKKIFSSGNYKLVHCHMDAMSYIPLKIAKKCNIPIRISHSHNTDHLTQNCIKYFLNEYARRQLPNVATHLFACSNAAGKWLFEFAENKRIFVIPNAIDIGRFEYNKNARERIRSSLSMKKDDIVLGHIGRFSYQKNHVFLLKLFLILVKKNPKYKLVMIGDGELKPEIIKYVIDNNLNEKVRFVPSCNNVNEYYNAFDLFLLPSHFEGLPTVLLEAQANGLLCFASSEITREVNITGNVDFLPIMSENENLWAETINAKGKKRYKQAADLIRNAGYDINSAACRLQSIYEELLAK